MTAKEYRGIIAKIVRGVLKKRYPGLNKASMEEAANLVAKNVHARMYGANVDGVSSPLWRLNGDPMPTVDASKLLED